MNYSKMIKNSVVSFWQYKELIKSFHLIYIYIYIYIYIGSITSIALITSGQNTNLFVGGLAGRNS